MALTLLASLLVLGLGLAFPVVERQAVSFVHQIDFKTDVDLGAKRLHYERQLRWYAVALGRLTGSVVVANLLAL